MESRKLIASLLMPALLCSGCSMLWVRGPKEVDPSEPLSASLPECSTSRGLPTLDIVLGAVGMVGAAASFIGAGVSAGKLDRAESEVGRFGPKSGVSTVEHYVNVTNSFIAVGIGALVESITLFISGGVGNSNVTACREARTQHAAQLSAQNPSLMTAQGREVPTPVPLAPATPRFGSECTHDAECAVPNICTYGHCVENGGTL